MAGAIDRLYCCSDDRVGAPHAGNADAYRARQLRRHPDRGRGGRRHRGGLEPGAPRRSADRRPAVRRWAGIRRRAGEPGRGAAGSAGVRSTDRGRAGRVGAGFVVGDRIPGMRAGVWIGPARRPADSCDCARGAQQGSRPVDRCGAGRRSGPHRRRTGWQREYRRGPRAGRGTRRPGHRAATAGGGRADRGV